MSLSALALLAALAASPPPLEVLEPGVYHAEELSLPARSEWLALCGGRLERVTVAAARVHDPLVDDDDQRTGWEVTAPCEAAVLLRPGGDLGLGPGPGLGLGLAEGPVREADLRTVEDTADATVLGLGREEPPYDPEATARDWRPTAVGPLRVELQLGAAITELVRVPLGEEGFRLVLRDRGTERTLFEAPVSDEGHWQLVWAGDLDGDGLIDTVLEASDKFGARELRVYLSRDGHALSGMRRSTGC